MIRFQNGATGLLNYIPHFPGPNREGLVPRQHGVGLSRWSRRHLHCPPDDVTYDLTNVKRRDPLSPEWSDRPNNP